MERSLPVLLQDREHPGAEVLGADRRVIALDVEHQFLEYQAVGGDRLDPLQYLDGHVCPDQQCAGGNVPKHETFVVVQYSRLFHVCMMRLQAG